MGDSPYFPSILDYTVCNATRQRSCKLIRNDITFQGHGPIFCADEDTNIAQYFFPFLKRKPYVLERGTVYKIRKEGGCTKLSSGSFSRHAAESRN